MFQKRCLQTLFSPHPAWVLLGGGICRSKVKLGTQLLLLLLLEVREGESDGGALTQEGRRNGLVSLGADERRGEKRRRRGRRREGERRTSSSAAAITE